LLGFWLLSATLAQAAPAGSREAVELRRVGVSRVGGQTLVTVVLSRPAAAKITPTAVGGKPQLVVEFPQVKAGRLPAVVAGDDQLVSRARTEVGPGGAGVKITLDLFANRPYTWWRHSRSMSGNQTLFVVGLKGEGPHQESTSPAAPPAAAPAAPRAAAPPAPARAQMLPPSAPPEPDLPEEPDNALPPSGPPAAYPETTRPAPTGTFSEVRQLIPQAGGVLQYLEGSGWRIASAKDYDRPGVRYSRAFTLTNSAYPELAVNIVHLPANAVGTPNINLIELSFGNLKSSQAEKYRQMRTWSFAKIKQNFEDIGDFFDDAMKPLRVELRKDCQRLALRYESLIQAYVQRLCPHHPKAAEQVVNHIKAKVSPRFEGVQYTISENPLLILNLVDFLYLRAYFVGGG
jgi:hypothetical protein